VAVTAAVVLKELAAVAGVAARATAAPSEAARRSAHTSPAAWANGTPRMVVTVKLTAPLTSADKSTLRFHGFKQGTQYNPKEPADIYCPPTQLAVERGGACIGFVYR